MASNYSSRATMRSANFTPRARSLGNRMTRHVAAALILFAVAQIWLVVSAIDSGAPRGMMVAALLVLIGLAIPFARWTERRWQSLGQEALPSPALTNRYWRDVGLVWSMAMLVPMLWVSTAALAGPVLAAI